MAFRQGRLQGVLKCALSLRPAHALSIFIRTNCLQKRRLRRQNQFKSSLHVHGSSRLKCLGTPQFLLSQSPTGLKCVDVRLVIKVTQKDANKSQLIAGIVDRMHGAPPCTLSSMSAIS